MVPPQLFVTTSSNLSITSIADYGAIPGFGAWLMCLALVRPLCGLANAACW
jgi:hypothetical protein